MAGSRKLPKEYRPIVRAAKRQGWCEVKGGKHFKLRSPDGRRTIPIPGTPKDCRSLKNTIAQFRRSGVQVEGVKS